MIKFINDKNNSTKTINSLTIDGKIFPISDKDILQLLKDIKELRPDLILDSVIDRNDEIQNLKERILALEAERDSLQSEIDELNYELD